MERTSAAAIPNPDSEAAVTDEAGENYNNRKGKVAEEEAAAEDKKSRKTDQPEE